MSNNIPLVIIEVFRGSTPIHRADFREPSITIGRGRAALLPVDDPQLSDMHAVLTVETDGSISLLDLGGETGLTVRGQTVSNATLRDGDVFAIGTLQFRVSIVLEETEATVPRATPAPERARPVQPAPIGRGSQARPVLTPQDAEEEEAPEPTEDVMSFILRSGSGSGTTGIDPDRRKVLEVNQVWGQTLIDTKHFSRTMGHDVTVGSAVGWKWHFLGIDMGWIPTPLHHVLPYAPPMWSEVSSDWRDDFYVSDQGLPGRDHVLFRLEDEEYIARVLEHWDGFADIGGQRYSFDELVRSGKARKEGQEYVIPMTDDVRLLVNADGVVFFGHMVAEGQRILQRQTEDADYPFLAILSFMTFIGVMFGLVMYFSPKPAGISVAEYQDRFANIELEKPDLDKDKKKKPDNNPDAGEGEKAKKKEGKVGKKKAKNQKTKGNKIDIKKAEQDRLVAESAGIASSLDGMLSDSRIDPDLAGAVGGLLGVKGTQAGAGGLGSMGSGLGGGGSAEGIGGLGTRGRGAGRSGFGKGGGNFGEKGQGGLGRVGGDPIILGALDRSLIDEVIKRNMNKIKYCYQRELTKNPALAGKVVIKFTIAKDGGVSSASKKSSTMGNASVEQCIVAQFMRMKFPEPKGGGIVIVSYPFLFSPG